LDWASLPKQCTDAFDDIMRDKFIALDQDKCELIYHVLRSINAKTVVEAGTSFGVSTVYLALAVAQNVARGSQSPGQQGRVIATEKEPSKASIARENWERAGDEIQGVIDLRVGDLRETLEKDLGTVDFLLLDSEHTSFPFCGPWLTFF
jgi:predicted O-methyltransferase YrrM